jgi:hypothetical protein
MFISPVMLLPYVWWDMWLETFLTPWAPTAKQALDTAADATATAMSPAHTQSTPV